MRVSVSTRGVRTSVGPRAARVSFGAGRTRLSTGVGPFFASTAVGGSRRSRGGRRTTAARPRAGTPPQYRPPTAADFQREAEIAEVERFREESTSAHLEAFATAVPPVVPAPPALTDAWAYEQAKAFHTRGLPLLNRGARAEAKRQARTDAHDYLTAESRRLAEAYADLRRQAAAWWEDLLRNDPAAVIEAVNFAYSDNRAVACAVGVEGAAASVVMRQPDADTWPAKVPGVTSTGRTTLKALTKRDRNQWWLTSMCSHIVATLREGFAVAPGLRTINIAVLTRVPTTQRIGIVAYGSWSRHRLEPMTWRAPEDAVRVLDLADEVECAVTATSTGIKALDVSRVPGLAELLTQTDQVDDGAATPETTATSLARLDETLTGTTAQPGPDSAADPYATVPFAQWAATRTAAPAPPVPDDPAHPVPSAAASPSPQESTLATGQNAPLTLDEQGGVDIVCQASGLSLDLSLLLLDGNRRVPTDADFVFYNQPCSTCGAARLYPSDPAASGRGARVRLQGLPAHITTVAVAVNADVASGQDFAGLTALHLKFSAGHRVWNYPAPVDARLRAMVLAELYRAPNDPSGTTWKVRAVGQGWVDGLAGLARDHGVDVG
ncbi:TerD family protein [Streptomyces sp. NPDC059063]|uniref:TerD family protein n=1 Tax=unclassified Streptomyces TaxID=2593676 RepID=UPI0036C77281